MARPAAINGPITNTSSSWMASNANALSSVSSGTSCDHSERIEAEIGGMVAPWSARQVRRAARPRASERMPTASAQSMNEVTPPVTRITCRRPTRSTSRPTNAGGHAHRQSLRAHHGSDLPVLIALLAHQEDHRQRHDRERQAPGGGEQRHPGDAGGAQDRRGIDPASYDHIHCRAVAVNAEAIGKTYPPFEYEVGKEKIGEYARAVGEDNPVYFDRAAAREAGFRDVVAPPMFAVVYSWGAVALPAVDPEVDLNFADARARRPGVRVGRAGRARAT